MDLELYTEKKEVEQDKEALLSLYQKILKVMSEVDTVPKDKVNDFHKYAYTSEGAVIRAVRDVMVKNGLITIPAILDTKEVKEEKQTIVTIKYSLRVVDVETGAFTNVIVVGQGVDTGDKAYYKAITGANKYALMKLFQIPSTDDPEADTETDRRNSQPSNTKKQSSSPDKISKAQLDYLEKLKAKHNIDNGHLYDYILARYGKDGVENLSKKEASELINGINKNGASYLEDIPMEEDEI